MTELHRFCVIGSFSGMMHANGHALSAVFALFDTADLNGSVQCTGDILGIAGGIGFHLLVDRLCCRKKDVLCCGRTGTVSIHDACHPGDIVSEGFKPIGFKGHLCAPPHASTTSIAR